MNKEEILKKLKIVHDDTFLDSFFSRMLEHDLFIDIQNEGVNALPAIFEDMQKEPNWVHLNLIWKIKIFVLI